MSFLLDNFSNIEEESMESSSMELDDLEVSIESHLIELEKGIGLHNLIIESMESELSFESSFNIIEGTANELDIDLSFEAEDTTESKAPTTKDKIVDGAKKAGSKITEGTKKAGGKIAEGAKKAGKYINENKGKWADKAKNALVAVKDWISKKWAILSKWMGERYTKIMESISGMLNKNKEIESSLNAE